MKKLILLFALLTLSCESDDFNEETPIQTMSIIYDSQDNIIKIDDGDWIQSINLGTFEPENDYFGIRHDWNNNTIYIKSYTYEIIEANVNDLANYTTITENVASVYMPYMQPYMDHTDIFYLELVVKETL